MQTIIDYLSSHPQLVTVLIASAAIIIVLAVVIGVSRKAVAKKRAEKKENNRLSAGGEQLAQSPQTNANSAADNSRPTREENFISSREARETKTAPLSATDSGSHYANADCFADDNDKKDLPDEKTVFPNADAKKQHIDGDNHDVTADGLYAEALYADNAQKRAFSDIYAPSPLHNENDSVRDVTEAYPRSPLNQKSASSDTVDKRRENMSDKAKVHVGSDYPIAEKFTRDKAIKATEPDATPAKRPQNAEDKIDRYQGKWVITKEDGRFIAALKASNGETMLNSESYTSLSGIKSGIDTLKKNIAADNYAVNVDKNGNFVFKIFSTAKRLLCVGEGYSTREQCEKAFSSVKRFSVSAQIVTEFPDQKI